MKFTDELERLLGVGSDFTIRGLLQDNAPALLELVRAAASLQACIGEGEHLTDDEREGLGYLRAALARLEPK